MNNSIFSQFRKQLADMDCADDLPGDFFNEVVALSARFEAKAEKDAKKNLIRETVIATAGDTLKAITTMTSALNAPVQLASVGHRVGLSNRIKEERTLLAKAFNHLQKEGKIEQVGFKEGKVLAVDQVNNFQRRWVPKGWRPAETE
jgi:hypothetical protein